MQWRLLAVVISPGRSRNGEDVEYSLDWLLGFGAGLIYGVVDQFLLSDYEDDFLNENTASLFAFIVGAAICGTVLFGSCARSTQSDRGRRVAAHGDPLLSHRTASASRMRDGCGSRVDGSI